MPEINTDNIIKEEVIPGCEAFHIERGDTACLLLHGLCGSPYEFSKLSDYLTIFNYSTSAPRYPGHGTKGKVMDKFGWRDWYNEIEKEYIELKKKYKKVYVIGFSTGAALSIKLAGKFHLEKLVLISTFISATHKWFYGFKPETYIKALGKIINYVPTIPPPNLKEPEARKSYIGSDYISIKAIRNSFELVDEIKSDIYKVTCPVLIIHSKKDITTSPSSADFVYKNVSSLEKEIFWVEKSSHIVLLDYEKDIIFDKIKCFLEKDEKKAGT